MTRTPDRSAGPPRLPSWPRSTTALRDALAAARDELDAPLKGRAPTAGPTDMLTRCVGFCDALSGHHAAEDTAFDLLRREYPELAPTVDKLPEHHQLIATILARTLSLLDEAPAAETDRREAIGRELNGLTAIMESHFGYEERSRGQAARRYGEAFRVSSGPRP
ncbi:MAG: hemerythrin domain-containing protein [Lapillicoccus sp.]